MTAIKICDVKTEEVARLCAELGVDYLGLHCIWEPPSRENLRVFEAVARAAAGRSKVVLVTRQTDVTKVTAMVDAMAWDFVQLHAPWEVAQVEILRDELDRRRLAVGVIGVVEASPGNLERIKPLQAVTEMLLFDSSIRGGTGVQADFKWLEAAVGRVTSGPFLVAGGLRPDNVATILTRLHPSGVDVQSGVERKDGTREKDPQLIRDFVASVRNVDPRLPPTLVDTASP